ncbi:MAG TPA: D-Ala-D-Ala carboxypeptidase family metallohydrolase [Microvirga sp.]|jgi:uncharacterized membrane protein|nr:D-Ala-D-Ala carboxypeptidase family metallohydrolase [Microvirga sp.]
MSVLRPLLLGLAALSLFAVPAAAEGSGGTTYASLPVEEPAITGSLPDAGDLRGTSSTFAGLIETGGIALRESAPTECLPDGLARVVADVAERFGPVSIESTHRSRGHNARAGGARRSLHLDCRAVDFRVKARARDVVAYLRSRPEVGGLKVYRTGIIHIDDGDRRSW